MTELGGSDSLEGRYFGRRLLAFLLDAVLASLIVALAFGAVRAATGIDLGGASFSSSSQTQCVPAPGNHPQVVRVEALWPLSSGETRENLLCGDKADGEGQILQFVTRTIGKSGVTTYTSEASYPVDAKGQPIAIEYGIDWRPLANLVIFMVFTAQGWRSPGKAIMALRVATDAGGNLGWLRALAREALRFLPFLGYFVVLVWFSVSPPALLSDSSAVIIGMRDGTWFTSTYVILSLAFIVGTAVWWVGPFLLWRGKTWYDALAGTKVVRTDLGQPPAPPRA